MWHLRTSLPHAGGFSMGAAPAVAWVCGPHCRTQQWQGGHRGWGGEGAPSRGDTLQEGCPRCQKLSEATSPSGRALPLNVMPIICPSSFLDGSPLLHSTSSRRGKPSWPWWPCAGWLDPGEGLHAGEMRLHYGAKSSKGHREVWTGGTLTLGEDGIPGLDVVPPRLDVEVAEEGGRQVEHGRRGVEHQAHGINEALRLRVHKVLQQPQPLPVQHVAYGCKHGTCEGIRLGGDPIPIPSTLPGPTPAFPWLQGPGLASCSLRASRGHEGIPCWVGLATR